MTYNLNTELNVPLSIPEHYFGQFARSLVKQNDNVLRKSMTLSSRSLLKNIDDDDESVEFEEDEGEKQHFRGESV